MKTGTHTQVPVPMTNLMPEASVPLASVPTASGKRMWKPAGFHILAYFKQIKDLST
jgi:hypothetical protein